MTLPERIARVACVIAAALAVLSAPGVRAQAPGAGRVSEVVVQGTQRIDPDTVRSYMLVQPGDRFDDQRLDRSLKTLFGTGLFADVTIGREGDRLIVRVVENPIINRLAFEGNDRITDEELEREVQLRPRVVFTRTRVQQDVQRIMELYRRSGRFAATVEPKVIQLEQNRVDLVFEIDEGPLSSVRTISFIGNRRFSDSTLRGVIQTKEAAWWRFLTTNDTYDPDRLSFDRELLRRHYLKTGFADFRVVSAVAELTPDRSAFVITFTLDEGQRYKFGKIEVTSELKDVDPEELKQLSEAKEGDWYNADVIERTISAMTDRLGNLGYAFTDIRPQVSRDREAGTIGITYDIREGTRSYVKRIDITGNVRTLDRVIRREFRLVEGDAFNTSKLRRSRQRIQNLGFFRKVEVNTERGDAPDETIIKVDVQEQSTGEVSFGVGYSTIDQLIADVGIRERNLLGRGQELRFGVQGSTRSTNFELSFTEPYFLERDMSAGVDLFRRRRNYQRESSYDEEIVGGSLRVGYELSEVLTQSLNYTLKETTIEDVSSDASRFIKDQEGTNVVSSVGQVLTYDRRDSRVNPTTGYVLRLANDVAGLGGDSNFLRTKVSAAYYYPIDLEWTLAVSGEAGYIFGFDEDVRISERFFVGGRNLRGFKVAGIGPRDLATDDALGGNNFYVASTELIFPLGLPQDLGVKGLVFTDVGSLWNVDVNGPEIADDASPRVSVGVGIAWQTALGLVRVDLGQAILKEDYDETELLRFSFGTRF